MEERRERPAITSVATTREMGARRTTRREYRRPPVHEVVFSLVFDRPLEVSALMRVPEFLRDRFPNPERQETVGFGMSLGPGGHRVMEPTRQFGGWVFKDVAQSPTRVVTAGVAGLTINAVRPGEWPQGDYAGWDTIYEEASYVFESLGQVYSQVTLERAALRYLNRIAVPADSDHWDWFTIGFKAPSFLDGVYALNLRQTWGHIDGAEGFSTTLGLATIQIPEPSIAGGHVGYLLDIEVFNLLKREAPRFGQLREWYQRAHDLEGDVFESSVKDELRQRFDPVN